ncbi:unnamed protein product [Vicia faba]|uniref:Uncharacterized protein n=1 Tax=Vicia faba TaxID=3906 RepID=A0AAV0YXG9_VICFA|nr:unnamed protein product [Vicia faba]
MVHDLTSKLHNMFALKKLGRPSYFLGIEVKFCSNGSLLLTQSKYIRDLLIKANVVNANGVPTPMLNICKLNRHRSNSFSDAQLYRSIIGALQYVILTRPDIVFSVNKDFQFMTNPLDTHWYAVRRILCYLSGTSGYGLLLSPSVSTPNFSLGVCSDSDWPSDPDDRRSPSGSCLIFGPNLVSWSSKKQSLVARSILHNPMLHARTKHIELDIHFIRECVVAKRMSIQHVLAAAQLADTLTKPLGTATFQDLQAKLKVVCQALHPSF